MNKGPLGSPSESQQLTDQLLEIAISMFKQFLKNFQVVTMCSFILRCFCAFVLKFDFQLSFIIPPGIIWLMFTFLLQVNINSTIRFNVINSVLKLFLNFIILEFGLVLNRGCFALLMVLFSRVTLIFEQFQIFPMKLYFIQQLVVYVYVYIRSSDDVLNEPIQKDKIMVILTSIAVENISFRNFKGLKDQLIDKLREIQKLESRWYSFLKNLKVGIVIFHLESFKINCCNDSLIKMFDLADETIEIVEQRLKSIVLIETTQESKKEVNICTFIADTCSKIKSGTIDQNSSFVYKIKTSKKTIEFTFQRDKEEDFVLLMVNDISTVKNFEKMKQLEKMKTVYFCSVTHDLKTPLNSIFATTQHLCFKFQQQNESTYLLQVIQSSCSFLMRIIEDVTDLSKIELKQFEVNPQWFDIVELFKEIEDVMKIPFDLKKIRLKPSVCDSRLQQGQVVFSDPKRIKQILFNLVGNALKFTFDGQVKVSAELLEQRQSDIVNNEAEERKFDENEVSDEILQIKVEDSGIGIKQENMNQLFKLFGKVREQSFANKQGIGLGLTICKKLSELLGGSIQLESQEGRGTTLTVTIKCQVKKENLVNSVDSCLSSGTENDYALMILDRYLKTPRKFKIESGIPKI